MANGWKTPRMYSKIARKSFLNLSKSKKRSAKAIRKCIRQQLQFIRRDIGYIADFVRNKDIRFDQAVYDLLNTLTTLYEQQLYMHEHRVHSVPDRIISIRQPWVRPIVRGKAHANTEFGAKLHISMVDGYARIERLYFDAFNEATDFFPGCGRLPGTLRMLPGEGVGRQDLPQPGNHRLVQGAWHSAHRTCSGPSPKEPGGDENRPSAGVSGHL